MTTLADQTVPANAWTAITGLTTSTSYSLQNKDHNSNFVFEDASAPTALVPTGVKVLPDETYVFTKGTDDVFVFTDTNGAVVSINEVV